MIMSSGNVKNVLCSVILRKSLYFWNTIRVGDFLENLDFSFFVTFVKTKVLCS